MDTSGYYPQLGNDDPLYQIADYTQLLKSKLDLTATAPAVVTFTGATWGTSIPAGTSVVGKNFKLLNETAVVTTDANGYAAIMMPYTFANGYQVGGAINGDDWARPSVTIMVSTNLFTNTANKFHVRCLQNGGTPVNGATLRVNYIVTGW